MANGNGSRFNGTVSLGNVLNIIIILFIAGTAYGLYQAHANDSNIHEPPMQKTRRIQGEIDRSLDPIELRLENIETTQREILRELRKAQ